MLLFIKIGTIHGIRSIHDFTVLANYTIYCRRSSSSEQYEMFFFF